jgi:hypothetical protein
MRAAALCAVCACSAAGEASTILAPAPSVTAATAPVAAATGFAFSCRLPAAKKSGDSCRGDRDCAPVVPCHARACVAKAKANPGDANTICTRELACDSADANHCRCFEGECALVPPG